MAGASPRASISALKLSPTAIAGRRARSFSTNAARTSTCTRTRAVDEHTWPDPHITPVNAQSTAASTSASGNTNIADLPPSSNDTARGPVAAAAITRRAVGALPVNASLSTFGCSARAAPATGPSPGHTLRAPAGSPASASIAARTRHDSGASSDGLSTTAQPAASAGSTFHTPMSRG